MYNVLRNTSSLNLSLDSAAVKACGKGLAVADEVEVEVEAAGARAGCDLLAVTRLATGSSSSDELSVADMSIGSYKAVLREAAGTSAFDVDAVVVPEVLVVWGAEANVGAIAFLSAAKPPARRASASVLVLVLALAETSGRALSEAAEVDAEEDVATASLKAAIRRANGGGNTDDVPLSRLRSSSSSDESSISMILLLPLMKRPVGSDDVLACPKGFDFGKATEDVDEEAVLRLRAVFRAVCELLILIRIVGQLLQYSRTWL